MVDIINKCALKKELIFVMKHTDLNTKSFDRLLLRNVIGKELDFFYEGF